MVRKSFSRIAVLVPLGVALSLAGCGKFFVPESNSGGGGGGTGNYFYVANSTAGSVAGFAIGTSNITNTSNSPYTLGVAPSAMAVTPNGQYLYVASGAGAAIYGYAIAGNGSLSLLNGGNALFTGLSVSAMKVDPSGNWLVAADLSSLARVFSINLSNGLLTKQGTQNLDAGPPNHIVFTPNNTANSGLVYISLGTGGVDIFTFAQSSGTLIKTNQMLRTQGASYSDNGLAVDPAGKYIFVAETGGKGLRELSIAASGALTEMTGSPFQTGLGPAGVLVDSTGSYVYVTNRTDGTISAFSLSTTGGLTAISGSPFATGSQPSDLAEDTSNTYLGVACTGGSPDFQVFTIGSATSTTPGGLTSFAKTTGSNPSGAFAVVAAK